MPELRVLTPSSLLRQVAIGQVALSPDGEHVVYTRRVVRGGRDRIDLVTVPTAGGGARVLTSGTTRDVNPTVSPDGRLVAYLSSEPGGKQLVHLVPLAGGRPRRLTRFARGVSEVRWAPDGSAVVVIADDPESPFETAARRGEDPTSRSIRRIDWRLDGVGLILHPCHLHLVPLERGAAPRRLTSGHWSASSLRLAPDGRALFLTDTRPDADLQPLLQAHAVPLDGGPVERVSDVPGGLVRLDVSPDGDLVGVGLLDREIRDHHPWQVVRIGADGAPCPLAPGLDRWAGVSGTDTDLHDWCTSRTDGGDVWNVADRGRVIPHRFDDRGATPLVDPALDPVANALAQAGGRVVAVMTLGLQPAAPDVYVLEPGGPRRLTREGDWLRRFARPTVAERRAPGPGGDVQAFLISPPDAGSGPLPTVLLPHGGPGGQWCVQPTLEALLLASAGWRVVMPNPRGSYSEGAAWQAPLADDWGGVDADDCHAVLDDVVEAGLADPERLAVTGLSYGGFLVNWLVGTSRRFRAAISENGVTNNVSSWANSDCGPPYSEQGALGDPTTAEGVARLWRMSPLRHLGAIETPLLILQAECDLRCPAADAEQLFVGLRWRRREVEYVLFPEEAHTFQGDGRFDRRVDRHSRVLAWLHRHLEG